MSEGATAPEYLRAAVTLDGKVLFYVRGIASYPRPVLYCPGCQLALA
jgi:hypothetical protein